MSVSYCAFQQFIDARIGLLKLIKKLVSFNCTVGSRSALFAATDPQVPEYCGVLKDDQWPVCPYISYECRPMNASEEAHNLDTSEKVWEKTLEMVGLPSDALEKLLEGEEVQCRFAGVKQD